MSGGAQTPVAEQPGRPPAGEHGALSCGKPLEFSPEAKRRLDALLTRYPTKQAALLPTLWLAQNEWGWISKEAVDYVASILELAPAFVWGVVTFYTLFNQSKPGKHQVWVCRTLSCALRGAEGILHHCEKRLKIHAGETTADGKVTLRTAECLASCGSAPMMQVDKTYHENLTTERVDEILDRLIAD